MQAVRDAERRGELLSAFDLAERGLVEHPGDVWLRHRAVLALARAGSTEGAQRLFEDYGLASVDTEDVQALRARMAKDVALDADGAEREREAAHAAALYGAIFEATGGYYSGINAATLTLLAGRADEARTLAESVIEALHHEDANSYYVAATEAEAAMVLGRQDEARQALRRAAANHGGDYGALSTTRRQLRLVCQAAGLGPDLLAEIQGRAVVHFCGHRIAPPDKNGRFPAWAEADVAARIAAEVAADPPGFAYGSLASGADIMCAEALLDVGAELHVVLPFATDEFVRSSVADGGPQWVARFQLCMDRATSISYATNDAYLGDDVLYRYGAELAMGLALLRARFLDAPVRQIAVWDGGSAGGEAGTSIDIATWTGHGHPVTVILPTEDQPPTETEPMDRREDTGRVVRAMLFADVRGFSKLTDEQMPSFAEHVLGALAGVLKDHEPAISYRNTWGDAVYVVLEDVVSAAACALEMQSAMESINLDACRLPAHLALRLGAHVGPVFAIQDPVLGTPSYMGSHVSRTARIEPVTPPGAVFATEPFAAALELEHGRYGFDYVGHIPAAKDFGRLRMYRLHPARPRRPTGG